MSITGLKCFAECYSGTLKVGLNELYFYTLSLYTLSLQMSAIKLVVFEQVNSCFAMTILDLKEKTNPIS